MTLPPQSFPYLCLNSSIVPVTHWVLGFAVEGNAPPPKKITSWFLSKGQGKTRDDSADYIPHDIYVIGTQEDPLGEKEWLEILKNSLQEITSMTFKMVSSWPRLQGSRLCKASQDILRGHGGLSISTLNFRNCPGTQWFSLTFQGQRREPVFRN